MAVEFTGERVIPGEVDVDLWNEHLSRYAFAARLARRKRVLDIGCGAGYGSAELSRTAAQVTGIDLGADAIEYARANYVRANLSFQQASATSLPFPDGSFDLIVAFEVIEHLSDWQLLLAEAKRLLAPSGQFVVSTPNKSYYAETRRVTGPNPFHEHEFEYAEFQDALMAVFPHTLLYTENHAAAIVFQPVSAAAPPTAEVRLEGDPALPEGAHFYVAVCAAQPMTGGPAFLYVPTAANVLREREQHIGRLESELVTKNEWLEESQRKHAELVALHDAQTAELRQSSQWAMQLDERLTASGKRIEQLQLELVEAQAAAEAEIARLGKENAETLAWLQARDAELESCRADLAKVVELLDRAEATVVERTHWAQALQTQADGLREQVSAYGASRWMKLGRKLGVGPKAG